MTFVIATQNDCSSSLTTLYWGDGNNNITIILVYNMIIYRNIISQTKILNKTLKPLPTILNAIPLVI